MDEIMHTRHKQDPLTLRGRLPQKRIIPDQRCLLCTCHSDRPLCQLCQSELSLYRPSLCAANLMTLPDFRRQLPLLRGHHLFALGPHSWPMDHLMSTLKYQRKSSLAEELAGLFVNQVHDARQALPDALLAVPMHPLKQWIRGFNQSALLAKLVAQKLGIPLLTGVAYKRFAARPQVGKSGDERRRVSLSHFHIKPHPLPYRQVAVFDDVITTGSTIASLGRALTQQHPNVNISYWSCTVSLKQ